MKRETLDKAKDIEADIKSIEKAVKVSKYEDASHFMACEHYGPSSATAHLPRWLNDKINALLAEEKQRLEEELEALTDDSDQAARAAVDQPRKEYLFGGCSVETAASRKPSWMERHYTILPLVVVFIDIILAVWLCYKYWDAVFPYFDLLMAFNAMAVILICLMLMMCVEGYYANKNIKKGGVE